MLRNSKYERVFLNSSSCFKFRLSYESPSLFETSRLSFSASNNLPQIYKSFNWSSCSTVEVLAIAFSIVTLLCYGLLQNSLCICVTYIHGRLRSVQLLPTFLRALSISLPTLSFCITVFPYFPQSSLNCFYLTTDIIFYGSFVHVTTQPQIFCGDPLLLLSIRL